MDRLLALSDELAGSVERIGRAVVAVHGRPRMASTGVHWRPGLIVTANHTVRTDDEVSVAGPGGQATPATVLGRDPALDVAVLKVDAPGVEVADVGDSDAVRVGHLVLAVGAGPRASWGVVSAIGAASPRSSVSELWSLDLTLYPGFSGGPLVEAPGRVIGLNTSGSSRHLQLAIPAKLVSGVVEEVVRHGHVAQAYLGVATQQVRVPEALRESLGRTERTAVIVVDVPSGSPAAGALLIGDVILALEGTPITDPFDLRAVLRSRRVGQRVRASVVRGGQVIDVELTIGERERRRT
jgi:S1-C subfamily serine protease